LILHRLVLETFRNHEKTIVECSSGVNVFLGDNGEGKTNILEGISYLCLARSFYVANDTVVMNVHGKGFTVTGSFFSDGKTAYDVRVSFDKLQNQKVITVNKEKIERASSLIGQFPVVILSPEQSSITNGSPSERRRFVDFIISQSNRRYLESLIEYRRIVKQRNRILSDMMFSRGENRSLIEPWNENLVHTGAVLIRKRMEFIEDFQNLVSESYADLAGEAERPGITYMPSIACIAGDKNSIEGIFHQALQDRYQEECHMGYSVVGPHRDEFAFWLNKRDTRNYASQGQHKTFLVALKLAELFYLKERCNETPMVLLDDVFSEMDGHRSQRLLEETAKLGQVFITSTDERSLNWRHVSSSHPRKFFVEQGNIERVENAVYIN
jgi:DNA replication and repair protein RecF